MYVNNGENISFLQRQDLDDGELSLIAEEHPYYSIAQFRLLARYKKNKDKNFDKQALVTVLFFNNTRWLNRQLYYQAEIESKDNENAEINKSESTGFPEHASVIHEVIPEETVATSEQISLTTESPDDVLNAFEPLHTVDYFASQGIRVSEEPISNDKLSTQLKSFTEWLKSMKKIHAQAPEADEQTDKMIQHIAETSNTNTNVVTEAMAEVLIKQDKIEQALEMYRKLSLNYPAKSAYFAAKIESLKSV
jgi:hypothetical protein